MFPAGLPLHTLPALRPELNWIWIWRQRDGRETQLQVLGISPAFRRHPIRRVRNTLTANIDPRFCTGHYERFTTSSS